MLDTSCDGEGAMENQQGDIQAGEMPKNPDVLTVHVDLDRLMDVALKGVRRTAVFLGLGLNAASREDFNDYELWKLSPKDADGHYEGLTFGLVPDNASPETIRHYKEEFGAWVINNGLRELVEHFALFLDEVHAHCLLFHRVMKIDAFPKHEALQEEFRHKPGLGWKIRTLKDRFGVSILNANLLGTLYEARNCLTHRLGVIVEARDCGDDGMFHLMWLGIDALVRLDSGKEQPIEEVIGVPLEEQGALCIKFSERTLSFRPGEVIRLQSRQLAEMCFFVIQATNGVMTSLIEFAKGVGLPVNASDSKPHQVVS